ncbi:MAG: LysR family transcriptional regulator, partial [Alphaproteobacteria bacterium]|nr:LysR family transcriptional regulator [Alphaproteobacteria bacterium]
KIGLSQPAVSHALNRLRHMLKDELFVRTPEGMVPTPRAERLAEPLHHALNDKAGDAPVFHPGEKGRTVAFAIEHHGEAMQKRIGGKLLGVRLVRHILLEHREDVALDRLQHARLADDKERLDVHGVDPVVGRGTQAQTLPDRA